MNTHFQKNCWQMSFWEGRRVFNGGIDVPAQVDIDLDTHEEVVATIKKQLSELKGQVTDDYGNVVRVSNESLQSGEKNEVSENKKEKLIEAAEKFKESLDSTHLLMLEQIQPGTLKRLFVSGNTVDFHGNADAEQHIGLGDLLNRSTPFVAVKKGSNIVQFGSRQNRETESGGKRIGYWEIGGSDYLEVLTGYEFFEYSSQDEMQQAYLDFEDSNVKTEFSGGSLDTLQDYQVPSENEEEQSHNQYLETLVQKKKEARELLVEIFGSENTEGIEPEKAAQKLEDMTPKEINTLRKKVGKTTMDKIGEALDSMVASGKDKIYTAIEQGVNKSVLDSISNSERLLNFFGNNSEEAIQNLQDWLKRLAHHESRFNTFAVSHTGCVGYFQFNLRNSEYYNINPFRAEDSVEGVLRLWADNAKFLSDREIYDLDKLVIAHNRGAGAILDGSYKQEDEYGNPPGIKFFESVRDGEI